jgi:transcriptional regulator GlxA family with amidase domain
MDTEREVLAVVFPRFQILDATGPLEAFSIATRLRAAAGKRGGYRLRLVARHPGPVPTSSGLEVHAGALPDRPPAVDTLLVAGGQGVRDAGKDGDLVRFIERAARRSRRVVSICTGAFLLARAGLLAGRKATTHWDSCAALAARFPDVRVEPDRIFVKDGPVYTSAGVTAGIDLALALVAEDYGRALALDVARQLVVFLKRPGGQSQFSTQLAVQAQDREPLAELRAYIEDHVGGDLSVPALAKRAGMSPRNFARRFSEEVGVTPARYVHAVRLAAARRRLEESSEGLDRIASESGFGTAESLRRAFVEALGAPPSEYRARFSLKGSNA